MADSTYKVEVTTTADVTGIKQVNEELKKLGDEVKKNNADFKQANDGLKGWASDGQKAWAEYRSQVAAFNAELDAAKFATIAGEVATGIGVAVAGTIALAGYLIEVADAERKWQAEIAKANAELLKTTQHLRELANSAKTEADLPGLANAFSRSLDDVNKRLDDLTNKTRDAQSNSLGVLKGYAEIYANYEALLLTFGLVGVEFDQDTKKRLKSLQEEKANLIENIDAQRERAAENIRETATLARNQDTVDDLNIAINFLTETMREEKIAGQEDTEQFKKHGEQLHDFLEILKLVTSEMNEMDSTLKEIERDQERLFRERERELEIMGRQAGKEVRDQERADAEAKTAQQERLNVLLRESQTVLQAIHQQQELINSSPFMGADEKQGAMLKQWNAELVAIQQQLQKIQTMRGGVLDPVQMARLDAETQRLQFQWQRISQQITAALHPIRAELQTWVNSWGTASHQIAQTIEDTIGQALQGLNTWIVTGKFNLQSFMQSIEMLGLKLIEQLVLQQVMSVINAKLSAELARVMGTQIAASLAPAATLATIASYGGAAYAAPGQVALAIAGVEALTGVTAQAHEGGSIGGGLRMHSGGLAHDEVPIIAQEGEIMIQRSVAERWGDFLLALNAGIIGHAGGLLSFGGGGRIHFAPGSGGGDIWAGGHGMLGSPGGPGDYGWPAPGPYAGLPILRATRVGGGGGGGGGFTGGGIPSTFPTVGHFGPSGPVGPSMGHIGGGYFAGGGYTGWAGGSIGAFMAGVMSALAASGIMGGSAQSHIGFGGISHGGGRIGRLRLHNGGPVPSDIGFFGGGGGGGGGFGSPGAGTSGGLMSGGGGVHVYAFTDLKALTKHMGSRDGQKIIFDTVRGNRISLGMK